MADCEGRRQALRAGAAMAGRLLTADPMACRVHGLLPCISRAAGRAACTDGRLLPACPGVTPSPPPPAASRPAGRSCHPMSAAAPHRSFMTPCRDRYSSRAGIGTLCSDRIILSAAATTGRPHLMQSAGREHRPAGPQPLTACSRRHPEAHGMHDAGSILPTASAGSAAGKCIRETSPACYHTFSFNHRAETVIFGHGTIRT